MKKTSRKFNAIDFCFPTTREPPPYPSTSFITSCPGDDSTLADSLKVHPVSSLPSWDPSYKPSELLLTFLSFPRFLAFVIVALVPLQTRLEGTSKSSSTSTEPSSMSGS